MKIASGSSKGYAQSVRRTCSSCCCSTYHIFFPTSSTANIEKVDTQLHVFARLAADSIFDGVHMEGHCETIDREDDTLVSTIHIYLSGNQLNQCNDRRHKQPTLSVSVS